MIKISIVISTYNRVSLLERLLLSIERQTFRDYEIIVVDDCSSDVEGYEKLIDSFRPKVPSLLYLRNDSNSGAPFSRNRGIMAAKYDYIALVDDDDEWLPEKLERQVEILAGSGEDAGIVYTWADAVDEAGNVHYQYRSVIEGNAVKEILNTCFIPSPSVVAKKEALVKAGLFDRNLPSCQDWDMWVRILSSGYTCRVVKNVETIYHIHKGESIGGSAKALHGYSLFYRKHLFLASHSGFLTIMRYLYRYGFILMKSFFNK